MTREQAREAIRIMQAWVDGKEVQHRIKKCDSRSGLKPDWCDTDSPWWDFDSYDYRVKPTAAWDDYIDQQQEEEVAELNNKIKELETAGDELLDCAIRIGTVASNEGSTIRRTQRAIQVWSKLRTTK